MLKTRKGDELICITQPDHAAVSGFLAARWGNDLFARPGEFAPSADPEKLRGEVLLGITQHDNGWWEWEASPRLAEADGLPVDLTEVTKAPIEATERWRIGVRRFQDKHPYASLLIGFHAYWLYAPRTDEPDDAAFRHPVFGESLGPTLTGGDLRRVKEFLVELEAFQEQLRLMTAKIGHQADWLEPDHYLPHGRLLQLMDALSLVLCSQLVPSRSGQTRGFGEDPFELRNVPRRSWEDRVSLSFTPDGAGRIIVDPYPFDRDKLRVVIPRKRIAVGADGPLTSPSAWYAAPLEFTAVQFVAA